MRNRSYSPEEEQLKSKTQSSTTNSNKLDLLSKRNGSRNHSSKSAQVK